MADPASDPWGAAPPSPAETPAGDWLGGASAPPPAFDWADPFARPLIPLDDWTNQGLDWLVLSFRPLFQAIRWPIDAVLTALNGTLVGVPPPVMLAIIALLAWQIAGRKMAIGSLISMTLIGLIGAWSEAMLTLSLVLTSVMFCIALGLPSGILMARSDRLAKLSRPLLDAMQTTPAFVYLVPIVMLFGIGNVPGVVVTIIFALPPLIRLTNLGIRQVPEDLVEAARSFGASKTQLLTKVQLPLALPTIMAGINQTLMLALSMVVIASMIAVGGLGQMVLRGIGRLDMGLATVGGVAIVLLAILIDRLTQSMGVASAAQAKAPWYTSGPVGLVVRLVSLRKGTAHPARESLPKGEPIS